MKLPDQSGKPAKQLYAELDQEIKNGLLEIKMSLPGSISGSVNASHTKAQFFISYDEPHPLNRATLTLERKKQTDMTRR